MEPPYEWVSATCHSRQALHVSSQGGTVPPNPSTGLTHRPAWKGIGTLELWHRDYSTHPDMASKGVL